MDVHILSILPSWIFAFPRGQNSKRDNVFRIAESGFLSWVIVLIRNCLLKLSDSEIDKLRISDNEEKFLVCNGISLSKLFKIQLFLATV